ncbi:MAG TPA: hypothetical protein VD963_04040, partial [Phycisphaerales bacterium]|nr:hypothetical protein [Phycisphaerales bacterium]
VATIETSSREALAAVTAELDRYKDEVERYREEITQLKGVMNQQVEQARDEARETTARLNVDITELQKQVALGNETAKRLQESLRGQTFKAGDEYALVDAQVIGLDTAENVAFINIGRNQKVVLGMTFEVYSEPTAIRPNAETGDYPPGKAALEVIRVDDDTAVARIVRAKRGNPVVRGDVIANAVYDPRKTYRMLVFGNFDANRDGKATPGEQADIEAMIRVWGGQVVQELSGNVDFLVLGDRPVLPPAPPATAPVPVIQEYVRQRGVVQQYDRLLEQARATSIPIINENRLRTLVGGR